MLHPYAGAFGIPSLRYSLGIPRIFAQLRSVFLALLTIFTNSNFLSSAFYSHFLSSFGPVPGWSMGIMYAPQAICALGE